MNAENVIFESGSGKWVAMGVPSGFTSNQSDATRFLNLDHFNELREGDKRYPNFDTYRVEAYRSGFDWLSMEREFNW